MALWDKEKRQRVSAKSYKGDLHSHLMANPHLEVYNRQDDTPSGRQLLAGQKVATVSQAGEARVVLWHSREGRKLPTSECPTPAGLCAFLRANPFVVVYCGQQPSPPPPPAGLRAAVNEGSELFAKGSAEGVGVDEEPALDDASPSKLKALTWTTPQAAEAHWPFAPAS